VIREATVDDIDDVLALWARADASPSITDTREGLERVIAAPQATVFVAVDGTQLMGSLIVTFDGWRGNMYRMAVDPTYRRRGIGRRLVDHAQHWLREQGAQRVTALVEGTNPRGQAFWRGVGFVPYDGMLRYVTTL
jgi:ribosomal protein S18 acetylase RimI-like enzyme